jgi:predicted transcriptional regulator of viral defense system
LRKQEITFDYNTTSLLQIAQIKKEQRLKEIEKNKLRKIAEENEKKDNLKRIQFREYSVRF